MFCPQAILHRELEMRTEDLWQMMFKEWVYLQDVKRVKGWHLLGILLYIDDKCEQNQPAHNQQECWRFPELPDCPRKYACLLALSLQYKLGSIRPITWFIFLRGMHLYMLADKKLCGFAALKRGLTNFKVKNMLSVDLKAAISLTGAEDLLLPMAWLHHHPQLPCTTDRLCTVWETTRTGR